MLLNAKHFGQIEYSASDIITFEEGLPGFKETQFLLLADNPDDLFQWLQSVEDEDLTFVLVDVKQIMPDYQPKIDQETIDSLSEGDIEDSVKYLNVAVVPEEIEKMRVNLKAPIAINKHSRKGKQIIAGNEEYGIRHYIFEEISQKQSMGQVM